MASAGRQLAGAMAALGFVQGNVRAAGQLLGLLGWALPPGVADIGLTRLDVRAIAARIDALAELSSREQSPSAEIAIASAQLLDALFVTFGELDQIGAGFQAPADYLESTDIAAQFFPRLADLLLIQALGAAAPAAVPAAVLLGVVELKLLPADPAIFQVQHVRQTVRWDRLSTLFGEPDQLMRDVYGWGTPAFDGRLLVGNIGRLAEHFADQVGLRALPRTVEEQLAGEPVPPADDEPGAQLMVTLARGLGDGAHEVGLSIFSLHATQAGGSDGGIGVAPYLRHAATQRFMLSSRLALEFSASADIDDGLALVLRAGRDAQLFSGLIERSATTSSTAHFKALLRHAAAAGTRQPILAAPGLLLDAAGFGAGIGVAAGSALDPTLFATVEDAKLRLSPEGADGFVAALLPADGVTVDLGFEAAWSARGGLRFKGGAGLSTRLAVKRQLGPLRIDSIAITLRATPEALSGSATLGAAVALGPVVASADAIGTALVLRYRRGNLGPVDLGAEFVPPSGIGLSVQVQGVLSGGGFLFRDAAQSLYAGAMQLSLHELITLKAFGLIATRLPDGSRGYSLLVFITVEDFRPLPLGLGFTLNGIGGMLAIHRSFDLAVLRQGLGSGTLAALLFPRDPVGNAPALMRSLAQAFPARRGSYLLGLLLRIGWGTPTLVRFDLGLILEFGARRRLLVLGRISALLPSEHNDLVRLNMDALGVIDFDAGSAELDAVLVDSRLAQRFTITGAMALRARWGAGSTPAFLLALGGLNPRFTPPAGLPALPRLTIALSAGDNPRLTCAAYFAITTNTLQFGARAQLYAAAAGFSVHGDVGFDVLVQLAPLHFIAEFSASLQLKRGSRNLFKVSLQGELEGPRPLRVSGKASFEILWCDFSVRFDKTLVSGERPPLPPAVDALGELRRVLAAPSSWRTLPARGQTHGVSLRALPDSPRLVLDPLGRLTVTQQLLPLNTPRELDRFAGAPLAGARRFVLGAAIGGAVQQPDALQDDFAPAQFFDMSDDDKLAAPSFERFDAGIAFGSEALVFDAQQAVAAPLDYEQIVIDDLHAPPAPAQPFTLDFSLLSTLRASGAAARAQAQRSARARFRQPAGAPAAVQLHPPAFAVVPSTLDAPAAADTPVNFSTSRHAVRLLNRAGDRFVSVPVHELVK